MYRPESPDDLPIVDKPLAEHFERGKIKTMLALLGEGYTLESYNIFTTAPDGRSEYITTLAKGADRKEFSTPMGLPFMLGGEDTAGQTLRDGLARLLADMPAPPEKGAAPETE